LKNHLNIILPSTSGSSKWSISFRSLIKTIYAPLLPLPSATCPAHLTLHDLITRTISGEQYRSFSSSLCSFLHSPVTSSHLGSNIVLNTLFSNTLSLRFSLIVSDQVSHPHKTIVQIFLMLQTVFYSIQKCTAVYYFATPFSVQHPL
jgi:hypothetical protein